MLCQQYQDMAAVMDITASGRHTGRHKLLLAHWNTIPYCMEPRFA